MTTSLDKEEYLSDLKLVLGRVREASRASQQIGTDIEEFLGMFMTHTVKRVVIRKDIRVISR